MIELINGDKKLKIIEGEGHNTIRDEEHKMEAFEWILNRGRSSKNISWKFYEILMIVCFNLLSDSILMNEKVYLL